MTDPRTDKITIPSLQARKAGGPKIVCLTAYDHPTAKLLDEAGVDLILVGDSLGMVVLGYENTVHVTMDEMIHHTKAVTRAVGRALVVGDMPYFSFHLGPRETVRNASRFLKEGGAELPRRQRDSPRLLDIGPRRPADRDLEIARPDLERSVPSRGGGSRGSEGWRVFLRPRSRSATRGRDLLSGW